MAAAFDPADDFARVTDGLVPVTFLRPGTSLTAAVSHALVHATRLINVERSDGQYSTHDVVWHVPSEELPVAPRPGDVLVAGDGQRWTVLVVQRATLDSRWRCVCRNLSRMHGLDQYIDIEKASYTKGEQGEAAAAWHVWRTGLRAKIQPVGSEATREHDHPTTIERYRIYCAEDLELDHHHRIRGPDGTTYRVLGTTKPDRIDALLEINVVRLP
jgi:hypothetical protein